MYEAEDIQESGMDFRHTWPRVRDLCPAILDKRPHIVWHLEQTI
jgi:hypothetical protein